MQRLKSHETRCTVCRKITTHKSDLCFEHRWERNKVEKKKYEWGERNSGCLVVDTGRLANDNIFERH